VLRVMPTDILDHFLIGSDGLEHLREKSHLSLPGKRQLVGDLSQFWEEDSFIKNPDNIRRRLALINRTSVKPNWNNRCLDTHSGHLKDDTTLIIGRRST
jgi:hypothetical protein